MAYFSYKTTKNIATNCVSHVMIICDDREPPFDWKTMENNSGKKAYKPIQQN